MVVIVVLGAVADLVGHFERGKIIIYIDVSWFLFKSPTKKNQDWIVCFNSLFIIPGVWYRLVYTLHLHILGARLNMVCVAPGGSDSYNYVVRSLTLWQRADLPTRLCFYGFSSIKTPENKPGFPKSKLNSELK